jgi:hypothetical protein
MNSLILCLAAKHDVAVKVKISEMERSQMSALQIKLTAEEAARLGLPLAKEPPCET